MVPLIISGLLSIFFIYLGCRAIKRKQINLGDAEHWRGSPKDLIGKSAVIAGWCFIFIGIFSALVASAGILPAVVVGLLIMSLGIVVVIAAVSFFVKRKT